MIQEQFQREIKKGTGKALLLMKANPDKDFHEYLFQACIKHQDYDPQCSGGRDEYLYEMIRLMGDKQVVFENRLLDQLQCPNLEYWATEQLFGIAKLIAKAGSNRAREVIYKKYEELCKSSNKEDIAGSYHILELDGLDGLAFIAEKRGKRILEIDGVWEDDAFIRNMDDSYQKFQSAIGFLKNKSTNNKYIKAYIEAVEEHINEMKSFKGQKKLEAPSYSEIKKQIESDQKHVFYVARRMKPEDIERIAMDFQKEKNETWLEHYLRLFYQVKYPFDYKYILKYTNSANPEICSWAIKALKHFKNEDVRVLIDISLQSKKYLAETFNLLEVNYQISDLKPMELALKEAKEGWEFHSMGLSLDKIVDKNRDKSFLDTLLITYERGYCANCREHFIKSMIRLQILPQWIAEEAAYDCNLDTRKLIKDYLKENK